MQPASSLTAGNYFVRQLPTSTFNPPAPPPLVTITAGNRNGTSVQVIDPFTGGAQSLSANSVTPIVNGSASDASIVGGERDITLTYTSGTQNVQLDIIPAINTLSFSSNLQVLGNALLQYDGVDGTGTLNATGLGGVSLNATDSAAGIQLSTRGDNAGGTVVVRIYSNATDFSTSTLTIPSQTSPEAIFVPFSSFAIGGGVGADFNSVGAIEVLINGVVELQATVTVVQSLRPTTVTSNLLNTTASVQVVKSTNGQDANTTTGPLLAVGSTATFTYVVTNTGGTTLQNVVVRDDNGTVGNTADDFNVTLTSGDTNSNSILETTETWTYTATRVVTAGQYTNIGTATRASTTTAPAAPA